MTLCTAFVGGLVADGTGSEPFAADVVVEGDRIVAIVPANLRPAAGYSAGYEAVIDCAGRIVAPGFVDIHCHSDLSLLAYPANESRITQGVTTEIVGNCGMSPAPGGDRPGLRDVISTIDITPELEWTWSDVAGWMRALEETSTATNVATLVGHGSARFAVAGAMSDPLDSDQLALLERELEEAFAAGVLGASLGLMYAPGECADARELETVARIAAKHDGILSAHLRDYRIDALPASITEVAGLGAQRLQVSHLRGVGGGSGFAQVLEQLEVLRERMDVAADAYPYVHGHTTLIQLLPARLRSRGTDAVLEACKVEPVEVARQFADAGYTPEQIIVMKASKTPDAVGADLSETDANPWSVLVEILVINEGHVDVAVESGLWSDVDLSMTTPWVSIASDGMALNASHRSSAAHPRSWGAFSAGYRRMRRRGIPIGEAVRRMTTAPADRVGLGSGIAVGRRADLVVFDDSAFDSAATFAHPAQPSVGLHHVHVNGAAVIASGRITGARPGKLMRR